MDGNYSMFDTEIVNKEAFKQDLSYTVKEYLTLESEIQKLNIALKERKLKLKALSGMILEKMETNEIHHINIKNGILVYKETETYKGLTKKALLNGLSIYYNNNEDQATEVARSILNNREKVKRVSLKHRQF